MGSHDAGVHVSLSSVANEAATRFFGPWVAAPSRALAGIGLIVISLPFYEYFVRRARTVVPPSWRHDDEDNG